MPLGPDNSRRDEVLPENLAKMSCPQGAHRLVVEGGPTFSSALTGVSVTALSLLLSLFPAQLVQRKGWGGGLLL